METFHFVCRRRDGSVEQVRGNQASGQRCLLMNCLMGVLTWKLHYFCPHVLQHLSCAQKISLLRQAFCLLQTTSSNENCDFSTLFQFSHVSHRWPDQCETFNYCCDKQQRHLEVSAVQTSLLIAVGECAMIHVDKS